MFKFIHAADIHLDSPLRGLSRYDSAPADAIRGSCRKAFQNLVELAIEEKVSFILLAGDLYDGDWKDYSTGIFLSRQMGRLSQHGIKVIAVAGNHDAANRMTRTLQSPANLTILSSKQPHTLMLDECGATIVGQSFSSQHIESNLAASFPPAKKGMFTIGLLHTSLDGREGHALYAPCSLDDLRSKNYNYWALGHIHKQEVVSEDPWIVFPGCIQGRHIRETGEKGCVLVTVEDGVVTALEKHPLDVVRWFQCTIDLTNAGNMREALDRIRTSFEELINSVEDRILALRIRVSGFCPVSTEIASYPERFSQEVNALAAEIGGDEIWIERVQNETVERSEHNTALAEESTLGLLIKDIVALPEKIDEIENLDDILLDLRQKLPSETFGPHSALAVDEEQSVERLIKEAKQLLVGRLLAMGDGK